METRLQIPAKSPVPIGPTVKHGTAFQRKHSLATTAESRLVNEGPVSMSESDLGHNFLRTSVVALQRKCACGSSTGSATDKCDECESDLLGVQTKAQVGAANDPFEHEADAIAERVMRMPAEHYVLGQSELQI